MDFLGACRNGVQLLITERGEVARDLDIFFQLGNVITTDDDSADCK